MEAKAVEDLADGPVEVTVEGVKVSLGIDPWGEIEFERYQRMANRMADILCQAQESKAENRGRCGCVQEVEVEAATSLANPPVARTVHGAGR